MDTEVIKLALCAVVAMFAIHAWALYAVAVLFVTGKPLLRRREDDEPASVYPMAGKR